MTRSTMARLPEDTNFTCVLCEKTYASQRNLDRHKCKVKQKIDYLSTNSGQRAFYLFNYWRKCKRIPPAEIDDFLESRYFTIFKNFVEYLKRIQLPSTKMFIEYTVEKNIQPNLWCDGRLLSKFYTFIDNEASPVKLAEISIKTILRYSNDKHIPPSLFFKKIPFNMIVNYVQLRLLSPWVLLLSSEFKTKYKNTSPSLREIFDKHVNLMLWKLKFQKHPNDVKFIKCLIGEVGI